MFTKMIRDLLLIAMITFFLGKMSHAAGVVAADDSETAMQNFTADELESEVNAVEVEVQAVEKNIEPVTTDQLRLVGGGIATRNTAESLALVCVDTVTCKNLRFVYFKTPKEAYYVGGVMKMPTAPNERLKKKALKLVIQDYFDHHQTAKSDGRLNHHGFVSFLLLGSGMAAAALSGGTSLLLTAGIIGGGFGGYMFLTSRPVEEFAVSGSMVDVSMTRDSGWNWAENARKVSDENFKMILNQIVNGNDRVNDGQLRINESRMYQKMDRLSNKGVRFGGEQ